MNSNLTMRLEGSRVLLYKDHCADAVRCLREFLTCPESHYYFSFSCQLCCSPAVLLSKPITSEKHSISWIKQLNQFPSIQANRKRLNVNCGSHSKSARWQNVFHCSSTVTADHVVLTSTTDHCNTDADPNLESVDQTLSLS